MPNIVITGHTSFSNRGNEALIRTTVQNLSDFIPNAHFTVFSNCPQKDDQIYNDINQHVRFLSLNYNPAFFYRKGRAWMFTHLTFGVGPRNWCRIEDEAYKAILDCDLLVVSGGDLLSGYGLHVLKRHSHLALVATAMHKPVVIYAHSFSPFSTTQELEFGKKFLDQVSLITVREPISEHYLKKIGVKSPIYCSADPAFWLSPAPATRVANILEMEGIQENVPLVGISASAGMAWYVEDNYDDYLNPLARLADYMIDEYHMQVIFISHVIGPKKSGGDDREAAKAVVKRMKRSQDAHILKGEYTASELKGVIGRCRLFFGSRMHTTISSTSMLVPTIGMAYSIKAHGVLGELVHSRSIVIDVPSLTNVKLIEMADDLLANHDAITHELAGNIPVAKEKALMTARLCARLVAGERIPTPGNDL